MFVILVMGIGIGALLCAWHRERLREVEQQTMEEMMVKIDTLKKLHYREEMRLYDEIMNLTAQLARVEQQGLKSQSAAYKTGRLEGQREVRTGTRLAKAYETQRMYYALIDRR